MDNIKENAITEFKIKSKFVTEKKFKLDIYNWGECEERRRATNNPVTSYNLYKEYTNNCRLNFKL